MSAIFLVDVPRSGWTRLASKDWENPVDASYSGAIGGRWNAPGAADTLYLNGNTTAVQANLRHFAAQRGFDPDELARDAGPELVDVELPREVEGADLVSDEGLVAVGLPVTYPVDGAGQVVAQGLCRDVGHRVREKGIAAISCRCAQTRDGSGRRGVVLHDGDWRPRTGPIRWTRATAGPSTS